MSDATTWDLVTLSDQLARRALSALDLLESYHRRIERWDPMLNAFRHIDLERAKEQAKTSDARKHRLGPLDGIPIAVKDNIDIEGLITRSGLGKRGERSAQKDAAIVRRLRGAGAVILGHTSMHEGALGATNDNPHFGRTHNPWRHDFTPGGSSGGSATAVAASLCPVALGTDTMGSIRLPAAYCGIAGYKPGKGVIDNTGIEPLYRDLDQVGPLARSVADLCLLDAVLTERQPSAIEIDLSHMRLACLANVEQVDLSEDVELSFAGVLHMLSGAGIEVAEVNLDGWDPAKARRAGLLLTEAEAADHYLCDRDLYPSAFSKAFTSLLDYGANAGSDRLINAEKTIRQIDSVFDRLFQTADLLLMPTAPQTAFPFDQPAPSNQADLTALANFAGAPAVSLPIAFNRNGLPIGLQIVGPRGADRAVLNAAATMETMVDFHRPDLPRGEPA
ncbi:MAG: amidase [Geminicoccaceae bacterium]